jgi:hypothetical protein
MTKIAGPGSGSTPECHGSVTLIRENILFGREMDQELYDEVLAACSLQRDLQAIQFF